MTSLVVFLFLWPCVAFAIDPTTRISQYAHTAWRIREGQIPGSPNAITQTRDGYVWFGTEGGLLRFDGYQFDRFLPAPGNSLRSQIVVSLAAGSDGSLLVGTALGLDIIKGDQVSHVSPDTQARIDQILVSSAGTIWYARARIRGDDTNPLCFLSAGEQKCLGIAQGIDSHYAVGLAEDANGGIWAAGATALYRWYHGKASSYSSPKFQKMENLAGFGSITTGEDGTVFAGLMQSGEGLGLQELAHGTFKTVSLPSFNGCSVQTTRLFRDRNGALWIGTAGQGLYRIYRGRVEQFKAADGLSGDSVRGVYEDREGVVWVTTTRGIDNFRDLRVRTLSVPEGLKSDFASGLIVAKDSSIWIGSMYGLNIYRGGSVSYIDAAKGLPGNQVMGLTQDSYGNWWMGVDQNLIFYADGRFRKVLDDEGSAIGPIPALASSTDGVVWAIANGKEPRLLKLRNGRIVDQVSADASKAPTAVLVDSANSVWVGFSSGTIARLNSTGKADISFELGRKNVVRQIFETPEHDYFVVAQQGLFGIHDGNVEQLGTQNGLPCSLFKSGAVDRSGDLWLYGENALIHIRLSDLNSWWGAPKSPIPFSALGYSDGLLVSDNPFSPRTAVTPTGEVWFATGQSGIEIVDPTKEKSSRPPPPVQIQQFQGDHHDYAWSGTVLLPPLTRSLEVRFAGLSFEAPSDLRYRFRLDGYDKGWGASTSNHIAYFDNLKPGHYTFRVVASNRPGIWNPQEAVLHFVIAPMWYQTKWFAVLIAVCVLLIVSVVFRLRVRSISIDLNARFDERLAERTRMARELHDTFLQTVQGSKMVADDALVLGATEERMRTALGKLSVWLGQAVVEGRAALHALRASSNGQNQMADSIGRVLDELATGSIATDMQLVGLPRQLHPIVRDELLQVGFEAIRNASQHANAKRIRVLLTYGWNLTLKVFDDGIGIPLEYTAAGREGHFGLLGMRERIKRIDGKISIRQRPEGGTEVSVVVPGSAAYCYPEQGSIAQRLFRRFRNRTTKE